MGEFLKTFLSRQKCIATSNADLKQGAIMTVSSLYKRWEKNGLLHGQHWIENRRVVESLWANLQNRESLKAGIFKNVTFFLADGSVTRLSFLLSAWKISQLSAL